MRIRAARTPSLFCRRAPRSRRLDRPPHMYIYMYMASKKPHKTVVTYTQARQNLADVMDEVVASRAPVTVTRQGAGSVVMISAEEFMAMEETLHLLRSPRNAKRLLRSIAEAGAGRAKERKLIEP